VTALAAIAPDESGHADDERGSRGALARRHAVHPPARWPSIWRWLAAARQNPLQLFPAQAYEALRVDHAVLGRKLVILSDPQAIHHVCGPASVNYRLSNLHLRMLGPALGTGLTVAEGRSWLLQRRLAARLMPRQVGEPRAQRIDARIDTMLTGWQSSAGPATRGSDVVMDDLVALSVDLIAQSVFDHDRPVADARVVDAIRRHRCLIDAPDLLDLAGACPALRSPRMRRAAAISHELDETIEAAIAEAGVPPALRRHGAAGASLSRDFVVSLITGFESVAGTCLWMMLVLADDPALQRRLRASLMAAPAGAAAGPGLLDACIDETLRLYPPLPLVFRSAARDDATPAGLIRKGSLVCMSPWLVHRHKALWHEPDRFDPARHQRGERLEAFLPFGVGARRCIGMHVGLLLVRAVMSRLLKGFEIGLPDGVMPIPRLGMSLRPASELRLRLSAL